MRDVWMDGEMRGEREKGRGHMYSIKKTQWPKEARGGFQEGGGRNDVDGDTPRNAAAGG